MLDSNRLDIQLNTEPCGGHCHTLKTATGLKNEGHRVIGSYVTNRRTSPRDSKDPKSVRDSQKIQKQPTTMKLSSVTLKLALALGSSKVLADDTVVSPHQKPTPMNILQEEKLHNESKLASLGMVQPLIVNGVEVNPPGKYPYMTYAYGCGASLVAPNVLLCAAHCAGFISQVR